MKKSFLTLLSAVLLCSATTVAQSTQAVQPDWSVVINSQQAFNQFSVIDANNDGTTWIYYADPRTGDGSACYAYNQRNDANDWLVTPPLQLKAGTHYKVRFHARANSDYYTENLEVRAATSTSALVAGTSILPNTELGGTLTYFDKTFTPTADGTYYIGFHAMSPANHNRLFLTDVAVVVGASDEAPAAVSNLTVTPAEDGSLKATLSFTAPSTTVSGGTLQTIDSIVVNRNGTRIGSLTNVTPGSAQQFVDNSVAQNGDNTYSVVAYAGSNKSDEATATVFVGVVAPNRPASFTISDKTSYVDAHWTKATASTSGRFNADKVSYDIYSFDSNNQPTQLVQTVNNDTTCRIQVATDEGEQRILQYAVVARNAGGQSRATYSNGFLAGKPDELPYRESFAVNGKPGFQNYWWSNGEGTGYNYGMSTVALDNTTSSDGDRSSVKLSAVSYNDKLNLNSGKLKLPTSDRVKFVFDYRVDSAAQSQMNVKAVMPDGSDINLQTFQIGDAKDWKQAVVSVPSYLGQLNYVMLRIQLEVLNSPNDYQTLYIDNVNIAEAYDHDLATSINLPSSAQKGRATKANVRVTNYGTSAESNYTLTVSVDGKQVSSQALTDTIEAFGSRNIAVDITPSALSTDSTATVSAEVTLTGDADLSNNASQALLAIYDYDGPTVDNLTAKQNGGTVTLNWTAPQPTSKTVTEDFESYTPWLTEDFGQWKTAAQDDAVAGSVFSDFEMPHQYEHYAYMVTNFEPDYHVGSSWPGHSGYAFLSSFYGLNADHSAHAATDHWLISPSLSGNVQTISFWASNTAVSSTHYDERVAVLYSTTDDQPSSFTQIGTTHVLSEAGWQQITAQLPEGATFFALRSQNAAGQGNWLAIDDITFEQGSGNVRAYNIYRDGVLIATVTDGETFTDPDAGEGNHTYQVTVVYVSGNESRPATASTEVTGIDAVSTQSEQSFNVYDLSGRLVRSNARSLNSLPRGVYIVNGKKVVK